MVEMTTKYKRKINTLKYLTLHEISMTQYQYNQELLIMMQC